MGETVPTLGQDVWCAFLADGVVRGRYAGERDGLHYVILDGDDFARFMELRHIHEDEASARLVHVKVLAALQGEREG